MTHLKYRADIDGLRALAILSVVVFHAFPGWLPGGFVGVDVFFVISGYLITGIILTSLEAGDFSFTEFYSRRIRRIFPALILVLFFCSGVGWIVLLPDEYKLLGKHIFGGATFISNFLLWGQAGYFDTDSAAKPLLHLWSLGIEEQFYILWPVMFYTMWKRQVNLLWPILIIFAVSFIANMIQVQYDAAGAFYSPLTRFWELAMGSALAHVTQYKSPRLVRLGHRLDEALKRRTNRMHLPAGKALRNAQSLLGVLLIVIAVMLLSSQKRFPGAWALLPTGGATLLIAAGKDAWCNRTLLSHKLMIWLGLISFPLYLWHWPLLSFAYVMLSSMSSMAIRVETVLLSVVLAWLTYRLVERPLRFGKYNAVKIVMLGATMLVLGTLGMHIRNRDGLGSRSVVALNPSSPSTQLGSGTEFTLPVCGVSAQEQPLIMFCSMDKREKPRYAILGDSKAHALYWGLVRESKPNNRWVLIAKPGCATMAGIERINSEADYSPEECAAANRAELNAVTTDPDIRVVMLVIAESTLFRDDYARDSRSEPYPDALFDGLQGAITMLKKAGKKVVFFIDTPMLPDPKKCLPNRVSASTMLNRFLERPLNPKCVMSYNGDIPKPEGYRELVHRLEKNNPDILFYDPTAVVCDVNAKTCPVSLDGHFLYSYGEHLSDYGNGLVAKKLLPAIEAIR